MITLLGSKGSMGERYQAILKFLDIEYKGHDKDSSWAVIRDDIKLSKGVIVATPTETHYEILKELKKFFVPVLCEKPISKNLDEVEKIMSSTMNVTMMMQYEFLDCKRPDHTFYNYYHSGKDGISWDCFQLIALGRGEVTLLNRSPIWYCKLNGMTLTLEQVQEAYVRFFSAWNDSKHFDTFQNKEVITEYHRRVHRYAENEACRDRYPS